MMDFTKVRLLVLLSGVSALLGCDSGEGLAAHGSEARLRLTANRSRRGR